jgi:pimeloyl-ACP methyl ester carboxylesterase
MSAPSRVHGGAARLGGLALLLAFCGCIAPDVYRRAKPPDAERITVLIPGYRGSFLYEGDTIRYLTIPDALSKGKFALGSCHEGPTPLEPGGPLTAYDVLGIYKVNVYGGLMSWGRDALPGFTAFGYDWREDLFVTAQKLCAFIGDRRANLIAHSMGGLVALVAQQQCGDKFDKVVFAATPFGGAPGLFYDLFTGNHVRANTALMRADALWTFPSVWQMLPRTDDFFLGPDGRKVTLELDAPATWRPFPVPCGQRLLARLADRARMPERFEAPRFPTLTVIGRGKPTCSAVRLTGNSIDLRPPAPESDGDGAVPLERGKPPFVSQLVYTQLGHPQVLDDPQVREAIRAFLAGP